MVILPFGNITKLIGVEDGWSRLIIPLLLIVFLVTEVQKRQLKFSLSAELCLLLIASAFSFFGFMQAQLTMVTLVGYCVKVAALIVVYSLFVKYSESPIFFLQRYHAVFLWSLIISIPIWFLAPLPEFVFYDGSKMRFGGLHFELFNYCFSLCIFLVSWVYSGKNYIFGFVIFVLLGWFSASNMFPIFLLAFLVSGRLLHLFQYKSFSCLAVLVVFFTPLFVGMFLNSLDFLTNLGLREQRQFDLLGSSIYIRLYPYLVAANYIETLGVWSLFPSGLGHFESSHFVKNTIASFGGTGSPKAMVDMGFIVFTSLALLVGKRLNRAYYLWGSHGPLIVRLNLCCLLFIAFGSGFFSLVAWSIMLMTSIKGEKTDE